MRMIAVFSLPAALLILAPLAEVVLQAALTPLFILVVGGWLRGWAGSPEARWAQIVGLCVGLVTAAGALGLATNGEGLLSVSAFLSAVAVLGAVAVARFAPDG
jgi:hypothetical protein